MEGFGDLPLGETSPVNQAIAHDDHLAFSWVEFLADVAVELFDLQTGVDLIKDVLLVIAHDVNKHNLIPLFVRSNGLVQRHIALFLFLCPQKHEDFICYPLLAALRRLQFEGTLYCLN